jgi:hypothetical protein
VKEEGKKMRLIEIPPTNLEQIHGGQGGSWNSTVNPETGNRYTWFETADGARSSVRVDTPPTHSFVWGDGSITIRCCNLTSPHTGLHDVDYSLYTFRATPGSSYMISQEQMAHNLYRAGERMGY